MQIMIPGLETQRLNLVPPALDCFEMYQQFYGNAEASAAYGGPLEVEQVWARLKADLGSWHLLGFGVWIIQLKSNHRYVGTCGFWQGKNWPRELTWWILPEARGQGIATEASQAAIAHAYQKFHWQTVQTYMNDENTAARTLVEKLGGKKTGRQKFPDGIQRDLYVLPE